MAPHIAPWAAASTIAVAVLLAAPVARAAGDAKRGEYVFHAGGCAACHTDTKNKGPLLAGGAGITTPFGTFFAPNITPDKTHGIGAWTEADFHKAMRRGLSPGGTPFYPVFPYTSFTKITDADIADLWAYLRTVPPSDRSNVAQKADFPFGWRFLLTFWRWLNFSPGPFRPDPGQSAERNRGAYLAVALAHCGECHTPRNALGGLDHEAWMSGNADGPDGAHIPNITPDPETGIGKWSETDIVQYLESGMDPDGDFAGSLMAEVVNGATSKLTAADRKAIAVYLKSLPAIRSDSGHAH